jgi:hypothetical protein
MTTSAAGEPAPSAGAGKAGGVPNLGRWLTRGWFQAPGGGTYQRRQADALAAAAGLGVLVVSGVIGALPLVAAAAALLRRLRLAAALAAAALLKVAGGRGQDGRAA